MFIIDDKTVYPFNYSWDKNENGDIVNNIKWLYKENGVTYTIN